MTNFNEESATCEAVRERLSELALGILSGKERSDVLVHVGSCERCGAELAGLAVLADTLTQLAPESEPPLGFEMRLADRLQGNNTVVRSHRRRKPALAVAAAVVALCLFGAGALVGDQHPQSHATTFASLTALRAGARTHVLGQVVVTPGKPGWVVMTLDRNAWVGKVTCEVTFASGKVQKIGTFDVSKTYGAWGAPLMHPWTTVRSAQLVASNGLLIASANLPA